MLFAHGFGCDQNMWRRLTPYFEDDYRIILFDLTGSGHSDLRAYDREKYASLHGYAHDILEILDVFAGGPALFIGHSVSCMIGLLAGIHEPARFLAQIMIAPSPRYLDDADYRGGFSRADIDQLLDTLDRNWLGWASAMAPTFMGAPDQPELTSELSQSFCSTDPEIAKHFAHVTFTADHRADLARLPLQTLIVQCSEDVIVPRCVGDYLRANLRSSMLRVIDNIGHCPHLSAPKAVAAAMVEFIDRR